MRTFLAALLLGGLVATTAAATTQARPALRVLDEEPLVVRATGFAAKELVTLRAATRGQTIVRRVRAGSGGGFTSRFNDLAFDFCAGFTSLRATGARSGTVVIRPTRRPCVHLAD
jgi:hypothetical protein